MAITYLIGDATRPRVAGQKVIARVCNDVGLWGKGFVLAASRRWPQPEQEFRENCPMRLGDVDFVEVDDDLVVANMCAQRGV